MLKKYRRNRNISIGKDLLLLSFSVAITCVIPVVSGISTQTSESDRMLYFPSVFVCMVLAYITIYLVKSKKSRIVLVIFIISYNVFFLEKNNLNWRKASAASYSIINTILSDSTRLC